MCLVILPRFGTYRLEGHFMACATVRVLLSVGLLVVWMTLDVCGYCLVLARGMHCHWRSALRLTSRL